MGKGDPEDRARDKQEALVNRLLKQLPFADPTPSRPTHQISEPSVGTGRQPGVRLPRRSAQVARPRARPAAQQYPRFSTWARVLLGFVVAVAVTQWPYAHTCGWGVAFYLVAATIVVVAGGWGGILSWRHRLAVPHLVSLGLVLWGLVLMAGDVLPRVGYARAQATWSCSASLPR